MLTYFSSNYYLIIKLEYNNLRSADEAFWLLKCNEYYNKGFKESLQL